MIRMLRSISFMRKINTCISITFKILTSISISLKISVGHLIRVEMMVIVVLNGIPLLKFSISQLIWIKIMIIDLNTPKLLIIIPFSATATSLSVISWNILLILIYCCRSRNTSWIASWWILFSELWVVLFVLSTITVSS